MKDTLQPSEHELHDDAIYKDVVVIGNGPSGLVTSFLLAGNVPRLRAAAAAAAPEQMPDDMLRARLSCLPPGQSLLETDLAALAEGLEGRSHNPIPLLMDALLRPGADIGLDAEPLIEWTHDETKRISHVVLGRWAPGGAWHGFAPRVRSLSPAAWLALPGAGGPPGGPGGLAGGPGERVPAPQYATYCRRYVQACRLQRYFRSGVVVTSVRVDRKRAQRYRVSGYVASTGAPVNYICRRVVVAAGAGDRPGDRPAALPAPGPGDPLDTDLSEGSGAVLVVGSGVSAADAVIAARGAGGGGGEPGGGGGEPGGGGGRHVFHVHRRAAGSLAALDKRVYPDYYEVYRMMCDGPSGRHRNYTSLPEHSIVEVTSSGRDKRVKLLEPATGAIRYCTVASIAVRTGSRPDLRFLQTNVVPASRQHCRASCRHCRPGPHCRPPTPRGFLSNPWHNLKTVLGQTVQICKSRYLNAVEVNGNDDSKCAIDACNRFNIISDSEPCCCEQLHPLSDGIGFGLDPTKPVDGRSNPLAIDRSSHELLRAPAGVYGVGPVVGDNFVRFVAGGALAAVAHIHKQIKMDAN